MKPLLFSFLFLVNFVLMGQKFKTAEGSLQNIKGIESYNILFEYSQDLKITDKKTEEDFLEYQYAKRERRSIGSGKEFKKLWFGNRISRYQPLFISEFNNFKLRNRHIIITPNSQTADYTMVITILLIYPGYDVGVWEEKSELEAKFTIYKNTATSDVLYSTETIKIQGKSGGDEFERVMTAYGELGRWSSKHFCRKT